MPDLKPRQFRKTFDDVSDFQDALIDFVEKKKQRNSCLAFVEMDEFRRMYKKAVVSHGTHKFSFSWKDAVIPFHHLDQLFYFLYFARNNKVTIIDKNTRKIIIKDLPIKELWSCFEAELIRVFPFAREEAIHMSAETPAREAPSSYEFSSTKKIE